MSQIALPFDWPAPESVDDFIVTSANRDAVAQLERPGGWPVRAALLTGPRKSGRSLLGRIFVAQTGGSFIDDAETASEADIFHRWNLAQQERRPLLIIALYPPPQWRVRLPDLASRLSATPHLQIAEPDDMLIGLLLEKLFGQRGLLLSADVAAYVTARVERSYVGVMRFVDALDNAALSQRRGISIKLAKQVLEQIGMGEADLFGKDG